MTRSIRFTISLALLLMLALGALAASTTGIQQWWAKCDTCGWSGPAHISKSIADMDKDGHQFFNEKHHIHIETNGG